MTLSNLAEVSRSITEKVLELVDEGVATPIILIDGRAGSGKSTMAAMVQNDLFKDGESLPRLIHMDDLYEGWDGLALGADYLQRNILNQVVARKKSTWQEFNWALGHRERWREFEGLTPLIVEGCGSLNRTSAELAHLRVWVEASDDVRMARWLEREGNIDHWAAWSAQELDFYARERSHELADLTVAN